MVAYWAPCVIAKTVCNTSATVPYEGKLSAWVLSAIIAGDCWRVVCTTSGHYQPSEMNPVNSIEMAVWVATGDATHADWGDIGRRCGQCGENLLYRGISRSLAIDFGRVVCGRHLVLPKGIIGLLDKHHAWQKQPSQA